MSLAGAAPYTSALEIGGESPAVATRGPDIPPPDAPSLEGTPLAPPADKLPEKKLDRQLLDSEVMIALLDARSGPITALAVQEVVNARDPAADFVPLGVIEKQLIDFEKEGSVRRIGGGWELTAEARAQHEDPDKIIRRRAELVQTHLILTLPDDNNFDQVFGATTVELQNFMWPGAAPAPEESAPSGVITAAGVVPRHYPLDVLTRDLEALVQVGVLKARSMAEEERARAGDFSTEAPEGDQEPEVVEKGDSAEAHAEGAEEEEEEEEDEQDEQEVNAPVPAVESLEKSYFFAPGQVLRLLAEGAVALVRPSVPSAAPLVAAAAVDGAVSKDRTLFEEKATAKANAALARAVRAEKEMELVRGNLEKRRLGFLVDEALGPPPAPPNPAIKYFDFTQTVKMNNAEKCVIFDELEDVEQAITEETARLEGAKVSFTSTKALSKERLKELDERKKQLLSAKHGVERTYTVVAYDEMLPEGDAESDGAVVRLTRAKDNDRILKREVLGAGAVLKHFAEAPPVPASAGTEVAGTPLTEVLKQGAEMLATGPDGVVAKNAAGVPVVTVESGVPQAKAAGAASGFYVVLSDVGPSTVEVIKVIRTIAGIDLKTAKDLIESKMLRVVKSGISMQEADEIEVQLKAVGATVSISAVVPAASVPPAPVADAAEVAANAATAEKAARAATIAKPKGEKIELSPAGVQPYILSPIITASSAGFPEADVLGTVLAATGLPHTTGVESIVKLTISNLVRAAEKLLVRKDDRLFFATKATVIGLVAEEGDEGLRQEDLGDRFAVKIKVAKTPELLRALEDAVEDAVVGNDINSGSLPGGKSGNLLWLAGQVDPRRAAPAPTPTAEKSEEEPATGIPPAKAGRGAKPAAKAAGAKTSTPKGAGRGGKKK